MKVCVKCGIEKPLSDFHKRKKAKDGHQTRCKSCAIEVRLSYYYGNYAAEREKLNKHNARLVEINRAFIAEHFKSHPCVDCGEADPVVLEFDHVRGAKLDTVSTLARRRVLAIVEAEIAKCEVRCANCHRRRHHHEKET